MLVESNPRYTVIYMLTNKHTYMQAYMTNSMHTNTHDKPIAFLLHNIYFGVSP